MRTAGSLVDTNILIYQFDGRYPEKQAIAGELLRAGIADRSMWLPHQAVVEFVSVATRLFGPDLAYREAALFMAMFEVIYPDEELVRIAIGGSAAHQLSWYDAHLWAYGERFGIETLYSEDFQDRRVYGTVEVVNPFS